MFPIKNVFLQLIAVISLLLISTTHSSNQCSYNVERYNATFDLSPLALTHNGQASYYIVYDSYYGSKPNRNFSYLFNVCGPTLKVPVESSRCNESGHKMCITTAPNGTCLTYQSLVDKAYAYQIRKNCFYLSSTDGGPMKWALLDEQDPSQGIALMYKNGDWCSAYKKNRELNLRFECENDAYNVPDIETVVESECTYNLTIKSIYGCPIQCGTYGNALCNSKGLCSFDFTSTTPKCFCYHRYSGDACQQFNPQEANVKQTASQLPHSDYTITFHSNSSTNGLVNITYDLSDFHLTVGYYNVSDSDLERADTQYYFNILDNINSMSSLPQECQSVTGPCDKSTNSQCTNVAKVTSGAVFQFNTTTRTCVLLGTKNSYNHSLLDPLNPAKGMILTYTKGGYCASSQANREFAITFQCPTTARSYYNLSVVKSFSDLVEESDIEKCSYSMTWETPLACPYECITTTTESTHSNTKIISVCSGRGICAADPEAGFVRCLCDDGYTGNDCSQIQNTNASTSTDDHKGFTITILVICILLVILMGVVVYLYYRNKSLRELTTHLMKTGEYEDGVPETLIPEPIARLPNHESESESESEDEEQNDNDNDNNDNDNNNTNNNNQNFESRRKGAENELVEITDTLNNDNTNNAPNNNNATVQNSSNENTFLN